MKEGSQNVIIETRPIDRHQQTSSYELGKRENRELYMQVDYRRLNKHNDLYLT